MRDIQSGEDAQIATVAAVVGAVRPDVLVLTDIDYDAAGVALDALAQQLAKAGVVFDTRFARLPNGGMSTGEDMDGDGRLGTPRDAQGYGRFAGDGGLAVLSRFPVDEGAVEDFSALLWQDIPGATLPGDGVSDAALASQRLSSSGHWVVPLLVGPRRLDLLVWSATPPVFDGPEDRNGLRNRDELRLWQLWMDGVIGRGPDGPFVLAGNANLDPVDGEGIRGAMFELLADPRITDPRPASDGGRAAADPAHAGDPALDTADWSEEGPGNLRVSYVLPSRGLEVVDAGVFWPAEGEADHDLLGPDGMAAGPHHLVWVDVELR